MLYISTNYGSELILAVLVYDFDFFDTHAVKINNNIENKIIGMDIINYC